MSSVQGQFIGQLSAAAGIENKLVDTLAQAASEVAHSECFDPEERAEVYAILDTLKADTALHRSTIGQWVNDKTGEKTDA